MADTTPTVPGNPGEGIGGGVGILPALKDLHRSLGEIREAASSTAGALETMAERASGAMRRVKEAADDAASSVSQITGSAKLDRADTTGIVSPASANSFKGRKPGAAADIAAITTAMEAKRGR